MTFQSIFIDMEGAIRIRKKGEARPSDKQLMMMMHPYSGNPDDFFKNMTGGGAEAKRGAEIAKMRKLMTDVK